MLRKNPSTMRPDPNRLSTVVVIDTALTPELRAEEVKRFFVSDCGVSADRLDAVGMGEQLPYDPDWDGSTQFETK